MVAFGFREMVEEESHGQHLKVPTKLGPGHFRRQLTSVAQEFLRPARLGGSGTPQESVVCLPGTTYSPTKFYPTTESDFVPRCPLPQRSRSTIQADACGLRDGGRRERP